MLYEVTIRGIRPIIMHSGGGLDPRHPANIEKAEITKKKGGNRTASDDARLVELECYLSLWLDGTNPTIPPTAIRTCLEKAARKLKQGTQVREGLIVSEVKSFDYDTEQYGSTLEELVKTTAFTTGVVVQRNRILRTRAKFDTWSCTFVLDCDPELVDRQYLEQWLDIAGRRIGLGDWRPDKSGDHGRFETVSVSEV